jgi:membrane protein
MLRTHLRRTGRLIGQSVSAWIDDYAPSMGAALAYYTFFAMAPLLLLVIAVAGLVFGAEAVRGELFGQLAGLLGADAARAVESLLASVNKPGEGVLATLLGLAAVFIGATSVFGELQDALDRIWRAPARHKAGGLWALLRARVLSLGLILGLAFLLMVSLVFGAVLSAAGKWWGPAVGDWAAIAQAVNLVLGFGLTTLVFAMIYKLMPRVQVHWHDVWLGATVTAALFTVGKYLIGAYIGRSGVASGYGAAGSLVVVLIWVYYSAQVFLLGAEFTWAYAKSFGSMKAGV